ncbi:hypothetical protein F5876DRAFT_48969 [Lentinula aff. lateritia]|uniref:Uncharacterized protein n=1 Tax=Lentinula aff. lateritia TaxID=2804960 RepID=A0ACC1TQK9_9AGAR|nr:hypothetical protein F5876DRAFT_48969 [Lentinula aff. lateritia]
MKTTTATLFSLPTEILEHIAFYYVCPRVLGPPGPLTALLLLCKAVSYKLSAARHLYARVFKYKFSFSAIRRRGFEPKAGEWSWQLRWWCEVLKGVRSRRRRLGSEPYVDNFNAEEAGVQETMYALWIMCLEDDGCNRVQMQLAGVYEWVEGYIRTEMYKTLDKGWPLANAGNSCAMWVFWYLSSKARLMNESTEQRESLIDLILPFLAVPFRYPSSFAPANHFRLPLRSSVPSSSSTPFSIPTPHGPFPIYLHPSRHTWLTPHFDRWTPLCTPLAADAAKLVYFSRRETMLFSVLDLLPRNREEHRARIRARLAAQGNHEVDEYQVETVLQSELPRPTQEDFEELNADMPVNEEAEKSAQVEHVDHDMQRNHTMLTGYPQKGAVYTPGSLNGLWTGRMVVNPLNNANLTPNPRQEAGHRPLPFNEGTLGLVAVPLYVRLSEYAVYSGGRTVPCAHDTEDNNDNGSTNIDPDDVFDQGIKDSWFPPNTTLSIKGDRVIASVPSSGPTNEEYEKRKPGTFHDRETCMGCIARERALLVARTEAQASMDIDLEHPADASSDEFSDEDVSEEPTEDLPPYVPSAETIPPCNGIRDVLITGSTDPRHAAAWGKWVWRGRVRKWDGLVGLVRSPSGSSSVNGGGGKIFFYGTLLGGRNLVGTWRLAHEDPRMPAYEGAFTLGRKDE